MMAKRIGSLLVAGLMIFAMIGGTTTLCRAGITAGDLSGDYNWLSFGAAGSEDLHVDVMTQATERWNFDGVGNWSIPEYSGTYSIDANSYLSLTATSTTDPNDTATYPDTWTEKGAISQDNNLIVSPDQYGIGILIKPASEPESIDLAGRRYNLLDISYNDQNELVNTGQQFTVNVKTPRYQEG